MWCDNESVNWNCRIKADIYLQYDKTAVME